MDYLLVKWVHIVSSTILFGTGIGSAFYFFMAHRRGDLHGIVFATRNVVLADWLFTAPAVVVQLATGLYLVHLGGYSLSDAWIGWALALYAFAGACWLPVVWIQMRMRDMAAAALAQNAVLPAAYRAFDCWWIALGSLAFPAVMVIFWLMVARPA